MIDSIFVGLSGMLGHERGLNVIGNNVSNMNTPGFRGSALVFSDLFSGATPNRLADGRFTSDAGTGQGLGVPRSVLDLRTASTQSTGRDLDLALDGNGFFVVQDEAGTVRYTRNGQFEINSDDQLVMSGGGFKVMSRDAGGKLVPIDTKALKTSAAKATTSVTVSGTLSTDTTTTPAPATFSFEAIDSAGGKHSLEVSLTRDTATGSSAFTTWSVSVKEGGTPIGSGSIDFIGSSPSPGSSPLHLSLALKNATAADVDFQFDSVVAGVGTTSSLTVQKQDGFPVGTISSVTVDVHGNLQVSYSNGQKATGAQLVLAQIGDAEGLVDFGSATFAYRGTQTVNLREAGEDLRINAKSLEPSNVDLTQEFSQLILMQRGYQASSQVVSTANDMIQQLLSMRSGR